jgi:tryptophan synthase beta chain
MSPIEELTRAYFAVRDDADFQRNFFNLCRIFPVARRRFFSEKIVGKLGGAQIYLKREDLGHTLATKSNNPSDNFARQRMAKQRL